MNACDIAEEAILGTEKKIVDDSTVGVLSSGNTQIQSTADEKMGDKESKLHNHLAFDDEAVSDDADPSNKKVSNNEKVENIVKIDKIHFEPENQKSGPADIDSLHLTLNDQLIISESSQFQPKSDPKRQTSNKLDESLSLQSSDLPEVNMEATPDLKLDIGKQPISDESTISLDAQEQKREAIDSPSTNEEANYDGYMTPPSDQCFSPTLESSNQIQGESDTPRREIIDELTQEKPVASFATEFSQEKLEQSQSAISAVIEISKDDAYSEGQVEPAAIYEMRGIAEESIVKEFLSEEESEKSVRCDIAGGVAGKDDKLAENLDVDDDEKSRKNSTASVDETHEKEIEQKTESDGIGRKSPGDEPDRKNPSFVPKKGFFFEHDSREKDGMPSEPLQPETKQPARLSYVDRQSKWRHDLFDEVEQSPKNRSDLVRAYGHNTRDGKKPPQADNSRHVQRRHENSRGPRPSRGHQPDPPSLGRRSDYRRRSYDDDYDFPPLSSTTTAAPLPLPSAHRSANVDSRRQPADGYSAPMLPSNRQCFDRRSNVSDYEGDNRQRQTPSRYFPVPGRRSEPSRGPPPARHPPPNGADFGSRQPPPFDQRQRRYDQHVDNNVGLQHPGENRGGGYDGYGTSPPFRRNYGQPTHQNDSFDEAPAIRRCGSPPDSRRRIPPMEFRRSAEFRRRGVSPPFNRRDLQPFDHQMSSTDPPSFYERPPRFDRRDGGAGFGQTPARQGTGGRWHQMSNDDYPQSAPRFDRSMTAAPRQNFYGRRSANQADDVVEENCEDDEVESDVSGKREVGGRQRSTATEPHNFNGGQLNLDRTFDGNIDQQTADRRSPAMAPPSTASMAPKRYSALRQHQHAGQQPHQHTADSSATSGMQAQPQQQFSHFAPPQQSLLPPVYPSMQPQSPQTGLVAQNFGNLYEVADFQQQQYAAAAAGLLPPPPYGPTYHPAAAAFPVNPAALQYAMLAAAQQQHQMYNAVNISDGSGGPQPTAPVYPPVIAPPMGQFYGPPPQQSSPDDAVIQQQQQHQHKSTSRPTSAIPIVAPSGGISRHVDTTRKNF